MKENYTFTTNKTANIKDFSLLLLDYLSRDDEDAKTFGTLVKDMDGHTVMEIDSDADTILFDRRLLQDVLKDIMNDVASLTRANLVNLDEDKSEDEDAVDDEDEDGIDDDEWEMDDEEDEDERDEDIDPPSVTTTDGRTFRVGDQVSAVRNSHGCHTYHYAAGQLGRIVAVDKTDETFPLAVRFDKGGCTIWMNETDLTLLSK